MKQKTVYAKAKSILVLTFALVAFSVGSSFAQGRISIGANLALPQDDATNDFISTGFGLDVRYEAPINDNLSWMGTAGFLYFGEKDNSTAKVTIIPINAGLKYYFTESFSGFYAGAELGLNIAKLKSDFVDDSETKFGFAPQVGYHLANFDFSFRYSIIDDFDYLGLRVAYVLGE